VNEMGEQGEQGEEEEEGEKQIDDKNDINDEDEDDEDEEDASFFLTRFLEEDAAQGDHSSHRAASKHHRKAPPSSSSKRRLPPLSSSSSKRRRQKPRPQSSMHHPSSPSSLNRHNPHALHTQPFPKPKSSSLSLRRASSLYMQENPLSPSLPSSASASATATTSHNPHLDDPFDPHNPCQLCKSTKMVQVVFYGLCGEQEDVGYRPVRSGSLLVEMAATVSPEMSLVKNANQQQQQPSSSSSKDTESQSKEQDNESLLYSTDGKEIKDKRVSSDALGPFTLFCRLNLPEGYIQEHTAEGEKESCEGGKEEDEEARRKREQYRRTDAVSFHGSLPSEENEEEGGGEKEGEGESSFLRPSKPLRRSSSSDSVKKQSRQSTGFRAFSCGEVRKTVPSISFFPETESFTSPATIQAVAYRCFDAIELHVFPSQAISEHDTRLAMLRSNRHSFSSSSNCKIPLDTNVFLMLGDIDVLSHSDNLRSAKPLQVSMIEGYSEIEEEGEEDALGEYDGSLRRFSGHSIASSISMESEEGGGGEEGGRERRRGR
jgi:hypothetical protein